MKRTIIYGSINYYVPIINRPSKRCGHTMRRHSLGERLLAGGAPANASWGGSDAFCDASTELLEVPASTMDLAQPQHRNALMSRSCHSHLN